MCCLEIFWQFRLFFFRWLGGRREGEVHMSLRGEPVGLNWSEKERPLLPFFFFFFLNNVLLSWYKRYFLIIG